MSEQEHGIEEFIEYFFPSNEKLDPLPLVDSIEPVITDKI